MSEGMSPSGCASRGPPAMVCMYRRRVSRISGASTGTSATSSAVLAPKHQGFRRAVTWVGRMMSPHICTVLTAMPDMNGRLSRTGGDKRFFNESQPRRVLQFPKHVPGVVLLGLTQTHPDRASRCFSASRASSWDVCRHLVYLLYLRQRSRRRCGCACWKIQQKLALTQPCAQEEQERGRVTTALGCARQL